MLAPWRWYLSNKSSELSSLILKYDILLIISFNQYVSPGLTFHDFLLKSSAFEQSDFRIKKSNLQFMNSDSTQVSGE